MCKEEKAHRFVETNSETTEEALAVKARDDALPERGGAFFPGDGGHGAEHALVLGRHIGLACEHFPLQLQPHLGCIQRDRACLPSILTRSLAPIRLNTQLATSGCLANIDAWRALELKLRSLHFKRPNSTIIKSHYALISTLNSRTNKRNQMKST